MSFELVYGALCTYSPRGQSEPSRRSRFLRDHVKAGDDKTLRRVADIIANKESGAAILASVLGSSAVLVPVPRSALTVAGALWPALKIAEALRSQGIGHAVQSSLTRTTALLKSAFQAPGERPPLQTHVESLSVEGTSMLPVDITLVDDFITKGVTLCACALRLKQAFPNATIRSFAVVRTMGLVPDVRALVDPCIGTIFYDGSNVHRSHNNYD